MTPTPTMMVSKTITLTLEVRTEWLNPRGCAVLVNDNRICVIERVYYVDKPEQTAGYRFREHIYWDLNLVVDAVLENWRTQVVELGRPLDTPVDNDL